MKRAAILFCGRITAWQYCKASYERHIIKPLHDAGYTVDCFLSHNTNALPDDTKQFIESYDVKSYECVSPQIDTFKNIMFNRDINGKPLTFVMYYHWKNAFRIMCEYMRSNNIVYDLVLYMRADEHFASNIIIPASIENNTIYVPEGYDWFGLNDQMAFGNYTTMQEFMSIIDRVQELYDSTKILFHSETYVNLHVKARKLNVVRFRLVYSLDMRRLR